MGSKSLSERGTVDYYGGRKASQEAHNPKDKNSDSKLVGFAHKKCVDMTSTARTSNSV